MKHSVQELNDIAKEARRVTMKCIASLGKGHVGGALDIVDALTVLYYEEMNIDPANPKMAGRDRLESPRVTAARVCTRSSRSRAFST